MKRKYFLVFAILLSIVVVLASVVLYKIEGPGKYTYLNGVVTAYDETPSHTDGSIIFKIDSRTVDIGGGLRPDRSVGEVYQPIRIGDKVQAKLISPEPGYLTVYGCSQCYVKKE